MGYEVRQANRQDCLELSKTMRKSDVKEIWSSGRFTPLEALLEGIKVSKKHAYSLVLNSEVVGMFGVSPIQDKKGVIWLMGSDKLVSNKKTFYKISKKYLRIFMNEFNFVFNYVDERNIKSTKWLKNLGFKCVSREPEFGEDKLPFNLFIKEKYV